MNVLCLPGDGVGDEIMAVARRVLEQVVKKFDTSLNCVEGKIGGNAIDHYGNPLPDETLTQLSSCQAVLLGAVGGAQWDHLPAEQRPEKGLLRLRQKMELFANLRPIQVLEGCAPSSPLKQEYVEGLDIMIVRELLGGMYYGEPRGIYIDDKGERYGVNSVVYTEQAIRNIGEVAFRLATQRQKRLCSVDKANVLEVSRLWREVMDDLGQKYPHVQLSHMYVDNAAMQLIADPKQFDVLVTENAFGDILSDLASVLAGSIGLLPSASLDGKGSGLYEPCHGAASEIAGRNQVNPLAMILSTAMMLRHSLQRQDMAQAIENAVQSVIAQGYRTQDLCRQHDTPISTERMGDMVIDALQ